MQTGTKFPKALFLRAVSFFLIFQFALFFQSCKKSVEPGMNSETEATLAGKPSKNPPPPPAPAFQFSNCGNPVFNENFVAGKPTSATITFNYINSLGGSYPAFTSQTVNGITLTAPAGALNVGSGSIVYTASGTPVNTGFTYMSVGIGGTYSCLFQISVLNPPAFGPSADPSAIVGSTGIINFTYRGQSVTYKTVRASDGKIWLQQNLGSPQVAFGSDDAASYGDYFQWGRWDDGHQSKNSPAITGGASLRNPSHIPAGNPNFIKGSNTGTSWWGLGGSASNTWSGINATSTNGKDPCTALGAGWHLPSSAEWTNLTNVEFIADAISAMESNLKLPMPGFKISSTGDLFPQQSAYYWSSTAGNNNVATSIFFDGNGYNTLIIGPTERGYGFSCRCVKD